MPRLSGTRIASVLVVVLTAGASLAAVPAGATPTDPAPSPPTATQGTPAAVSGDAEPGTAADDRVLVTVAPGTTDAEAHTIADRTGATLEARTGSTLILDPAAPTDLRAASATLTGQPGVVAVEPNLKLTASAATNDTYWTDQYGLSDSQPGGIRAQSAWNDTPGSRDVVVGVLDSGAALNHPDLVANLWTNRTGIGGCVYGTHGYNAVTASESGHGENGCVPSDDDGHGTHVAGIVGATGNNNRGVTGVAQRVSIMPLRMLFHVEPVPECVGGSCATGSVADAVKAIDWALAAKSQGVNLRVLQASWGSATSSVALSQAVARANAAGVLFVAAAGNGELVTGNPGVVVPVDLDAPGKNEFPCEDASPNVICVAATDQLDALASFSNYGATAVDIAAPGFNIMSTVPTGMIIGCADPSYCEFSGTSMAAPMVSGAAVDILAAEPALGVSDLRTRILTSVDTPAGLSGKVATNGRLDVCKAVPNCDGRPAIAPTAPTAVRVQVGDGTASVSWGAPDSNGNSFIVAGYDVKGPNGTTHYPFTVTSATLTGLSNNVLANVRVRAVGTSANPNGPWVAVPIRPYVGGFEPDGYGPLHPISVGGKHPSGAFGGPSWGSWDIARAVAILPTGTGGYEVDGYGGLHPFRIGAGSPMPPAATGGPYWGGWDIARGVTMNPTGGGYVLDGYGGVHPFGLGAAAPAPIAKNYPYWGGWDIARGITMAPNGKGGYVVDGYGVVHRFTSRNGTPVAASGYATWNGWSIVRGITLVPGTGGGWTLDGYGGVHPFSTTGPAPAPPTASPKWPGWDIARGFDV